MIGEEDDECDDENFSGMEHVNLFLKIHPGYLSKDVEHLNAHFDRVNKDRNERYQRLL